MRGFNLLSAVLVVLSLFAVPALADEGCPITSQLAKIVSSASYDVSSDDQCSTLVFTNGSSVAVTLPDAATDIPVGFTISMIAQSGTVTVTPQTSTINGQSTFVLSSGSGALISMDGTNYHANGGGSGSAGMSVSAANATSAALQHILSASANAGGGGGGTSLPFPGLTGTVWAAQNLYLSYGTTGSPVTTAGPMAKISKTENIAASACGSNEVDNSCNAVLSLIAAGTSSDGMQVNALAASATSLGSTDAVAVLGIGQSLTGSTGRGTGAYIESDAYGFGANSEFRVSNFTGVDATYDTGGASNMVNIWLSANSTSPSKTVGAAIQLGGINSSSYLVGLGCVNNSVKNACIEDDSSAATAVLLNGNHTNAINITGTNTFSILYPGGSIDGSGNATFKSVLLAVPSGNAELEFFNTSTLKWYWALNTSNNGFFGFDQGNSALFFLVTSAGVTSIGEASNTLDLIGSTLQINGTNGTTGSTCTAWTDGLCTHS